MTNKTMSATTAGTPIFDALLSELAMTWQADDDVTVDEQDQAPDDTVAT